MKILKCKISLWSLVKNIENEDIFETADNIKHKLSFQIAWISCVWREILSKYSYRFDLNKKEIQNEMEDHGVVSSMVVLRKA